MVQRTIVHTQETGVGLALVWWWSSRIWDIKEAINQNRTRWNNVVNSRTNAVIVRYECLRFMCGSWKKTLIWLVLTSIELMWKRANVGFTSWRRPDILTFHYSWRCYAPNNAKLPPLHRFIVLELLSCLIEHFCLPVCKSFRNRQRGLWLSFVTFETAPCFPPREFLVGGLLRSDVHFPRERLGSARTLHGSRYTGSINTFPTGLHRQ